MRILFITDPLETFKTYKDSTYAMMTEAAARGHELYWCLQPQLCLSGSTVETLATRLHLTGDDHAWYREGNSALEPLSAFDAVLMRKDPPFDMEYVTSTWLLELAEQQGARVFNKPRAIRDHSEKLAIARHPEFITPTLVTRDLARIRDFHAEHRDIIVKPLDGMGGMGVFRVGPDGMNLAAIVETLGQDGARTLMVQRYIPAIKDGDKRILLIGGVPVPYSLARVPMAGEVRGNLAAGGSGRAQELSQRDREIAESLAPGLWEQGLLLVGLDVIGDYLTEVNVTSPTCFQEITQQTGFHVAAMFIDALEHAVGAAGG
ncbi:glutathione synthase [Cupriavidus oxalaticus]|jgi:glutathione synthase|uniref:Glutathione synthetase n=1 Tax=Cupriavidus oxalaticus TaxID=96344 RepID=A0A375FZA6_9BURK|nr:glutathione synthase [Cupriavidus oxalaticus]QEZ45462.1 glutathione synthase [Cupriavidus oxalaticus]QRQ87138.1 glutathione synthase [Cupriavidus oxalaticus]QRQ94534.1 glutathione synthase [Cupriavidus oxalaticus]WQD83178.1 glutathione synthase [Cupriavidus oxalaticus]SPC11138.1 Glutathione synthetase [Cupriavidus oxalaticus]